MDDEKIWSHERKQLLLTVRLKYEDQFNSERIKKSVLWRKVHNEIKIIDPKFPYTVDEIMRKYNMNLMVTYRRIKKRNQITGQVTTSWGYYDQMDEICGSKFSSNTSEFISNTSAKSVVSEEIFRHEPSRSFKTNKQPQTIQKYGNIDIIKFLENESEEDRKLMLELLKLEKEKLKVEKEKIEELKQLKVVLNSFLK